MTSCECGCGQEVKNRFVNGHSRKNHKLTEETKKKISVALTGQIPWNIGKSYPGTPCSEKTKKKISEATKGKKHKPMSDTGREHISKAHIGQPATSGTFKKGHHFTEEIRKKAAQSISENARVNPNYGMRGKRMSEDTKEKIRKVHSSPKFIELHRNVRLRQILPTKDTSIELKLQAELSSRGIPYTKHFPVIGQPDIAFPDRRIAVFADGDYWHNLPQQKEKDARTTGQLRSDGWTVLRFWEHEINANVDGVVDEIEEMLCGEFVGGGEHDLELNNRNESDPSRTGEPSLTEIWRSRESADMPEVEGIKADILQGRNGI